MYTGRKMKSIVMVFALILSSSLGFSQTKEIKIKFIGNCGLHLTDGDLNIYVDFPYKSGAFNYMEFDKAELDSIKENSIFIFTHKHADHYSSKNMRKTLRNVSFGSNRLNISFLHRFFMDLVKKARI